MQPIVSLKNVEKRYDGVVAVKDLDLDIYPGDFLTFLGPSGCGKTTILRLIAGFETADKGEIVIENKRVNEIPANQRNVNTIFQSYALFPHMNVFHNVAFALKMRGLDKQSIAAQVNNVLGLVKLTGFENRRIYELSGGQQQRVAIARALAAQPAVLLLDEPFSALDLKLRQEMRLELRRLHRELGITFIFVTHDQEEAISMSNRIAVLDNGCLEQIGSPREIYEEPKNLFVAQFVGEINHFPATVVKTMARAMVVDIFGQQYRFANTRGFTVGDHVRVLLRPEDIILANVDKNENDAALSGVVEELIYKGSTYDLIVRLTSDTSIKAAKFFDEDAEEVLFKPGDQVRIGWFDGWEVVLPDG